MKGVFNKALISEGRSKIRFSRKSTLLLYFLMLLFGGCKKDKEEKKSFEIGTVTDIENNVYRTIKIGEQWWMAENLRVKTFRNGNPISQHQTSDTWQESTSSYCLYDNNENSPGILYNWYSVNSLDLIAPTGWHIPSDEEWKDLERNLGMSLSESEKQSWRGSNEGEKLKIEGTTGWTFYDGVWATNESGFSAMAGSCRLFNGLWGSPGLFATGFWWTSSETNDNKEVWYRYLDYKSKGVFRSHCSKNYGFSIRCVKD